MLVKLVLRLALATVLNAKQGHFLALIGLVCSSFVSISAGTHRRAPWDPYGQTHIPMVQMGNELAARKLVSTSWTWKVVLEGFETKNHWSLYISLAIVGKDFISRPLQNPFNVLWPTYHTNFTNHLGPKNLQAWYARLLPGMSMLERSWWPGYSTYNYASWSMSYSLWVVDRCNPRHTGSLYKYFLDTPTFAAQGSAPDLRHHIDGRSMDLGAATEFGCGLASGSAILVELFATGPVVSKKETMLIIFKMEPEWSCIGNCYPSHICFNLQTWSLVCPWVPQYCFVNVFKDEIGMQW